jgi:hypothetical protein
MRVRALTYVSICEVSTRRASILFYILYFSFYVLGSIVVDAGRNYVSGVHASQPHHPMSDPTTNFAPDQPLIRQKMANICTDFGVGCDNSFSLCCMSMMTKSSEF